MNYHNVSGTLHFTTFQAFYRSLEPLSVYPSPQGSNSRLQLSFNTVNFIIKYLHIHKNITNPKSMQLHELTQKHHLKLKLQNFTFYFRLSVLYIFCGLTHHQKQKVHSTTNLISPFMICVITFIQ